MKDTLTEFGVDASARVERALQELQAGRGVLLIDDYDRENEGDLIFSAEKMNLTDMVQMIRYCSGVICLCMPHEKADKLDLPYMVAENASPFQTPFTVSIDAKRGITTGLSAADRLAAIQAATADDAVATDLVRPGHIFPLRAHAYGVLGRNGHTEGSVDLMKLAGLKPMSVLCELMNDDGTMSRLPQIIGFAKHHGMMVLAIADIIAYRKAKA
ncbi:3,4-dihydroxy-2-butanone-4-phosphate synthase [Sphingobacterium sp. MYb382]|uniref:3,4-dihydroxy-2-butanone-4-phosphate synthase n=1 Tax=Sphingobacterium sp. MYb382 TaxID=2745278 RepID=UPI0030A13B2C